MLKVNIPLKTYDDIEEVLVHNTHYNNVKIALYFVEDCNIRTSEMEVCISLIKRWLNGENVGRDLRIAGNKVIETIICRPAQYAAYHAVRTILTSYVIESVKYAFLASKCTYPYSEQFCKHNEYLNYIQLYGCEDPNFPYRKEAKTFNLDNDTDLNIFLDFLTDNYPTAITYDREEYFTKRLPREYLRILYQ